MRKHFNKFKSNFKRQIGKNRGKYLIDRGAELAVYGVLAEQLKAHRRRWGDEGTGYIERDERRLNNREMRRIANEYLSKNNLRQVKSLETVRSWGGSRNKSSRQAKQHRGQNLWCHVRSQKKAGARHINIHYNRCHIKNYTRLAFGFNNKKYVIRRANDDKAYVRCGTSEGFSRPLHPPVQPTVENFQLPASDYPDPVGYVSPGVIVMVNNMEEVWHDNKDTFKPGDASISVTCKPKYVYPSSATNWANDMFAVRYVYRKEHEQVKQDASQTNASNLPENLVDTLIMLRDTPFQYEIMNIPEDYLKVCEDGDHLQRERLRCHVMEKRLSMCLPTLSQPGAPPYIHQKILELKDQLSQISMYFDDVLTVQSSCKN